jgi:acyl-CoA synthetase (AMP-forming)/AMP-acid ligase II
LNLPFFLRQISEEQVHYTVAPPALLTLLLKNEALLSSADISTIRAIGSGSAPLSPWMVTEWQERFGIAVTNVFGSNEGATFVSGAAAVPDPTERASFFPRFGVPGLAWPDRIASMMESRLVDPDTGAVIDLPGVPGEMRIRGAAVFSGYFRDPDRSAAAFDEDGFYRTGDLFEIDPSARFYRHVGRAGDVINRGGMKISPEEIEAALASHPGIADVAVLGYPDDVMGQKVGVAAVVRDGVMLTLESVRDHVAAAGLAEFKAPERLVLVESLPRNPVGKVLRSRLRETMAAG